LAGEFPFPLVAPLRLALEASLDSGRWKVLERFRDHNDERKKNEHEWNMFEEQVAVLHKS
jgi:hypothetical protein